MLLHISNTDQTVYHNDKFMNIIPCILAVYFKALILIHLNDTNIKMISNRLVTLSQYHLFCKKNPDKHP